MAAVVVVAAVAAAVETGTKPLRVVYTSGLPIRQPRYFLPRIAHQRDAFLGLPTRPDRAVPGSVSLQGVLCLRLLI